MRKWRVSRDYDGGWHHVYDGSGMVRADVFGAKDALLVSRALANSRGEEAEDQDPERLVPVMFDRAIVGDE